MRESSPGAVMITPQFMNSAYPVGMCLRTRARAYSITARFSGVSEARQAATVVGRAAFAVERVGFLAAIDFVPRAWVLLPGGDCVFHTSSRHPPRRGLLARLFGMDDLSRAIGRH
jgi:hypothetical protein